MTWIPSRLPEQTGRTFVITGGNAGLGYFAAEQLASTGAHIVLAGRNPGRIHTAIRSIRGRVPGASLDTIPLDVASLDSVRSAGAVLAGFGRLDGLLLNAGLTSGPRHRHTTVDGNELILGTNFVGHFALTALAWPALARTAGSRVVGLGSLATLLVPLEADDLQSERSFGFFRAYGFSKHAVHGFLTELNRRAPGRGFLAHPGYAIDGLSPSRPGINDVSAANRAGSLALAAGAQGKNRGAAPVVRALLDDSLGGGELIGPQRLTRGRPVEQRPVASSSSPEFGEHLWNLAEQWTETVFAV